MLLLEILGGNIPDVVKVAVDCQKFGAEGITIHPRPDQRHIKYSDVYDLQSKVNTEFNIEGNPNSEFISLIKNKTNTGNSSSDATDALLLMQVGTLNSQRFSDGYSWEISIYGVRTSIFVDPIPEMIRMASQIGADRIELYTGPYAEQYKANKESCTPYRSCNTCKNLGLGINAGMI